MKWRSILFKPSSLVPIFSIQSPLHRVPHHPLFFPLAFSITLYPPPIVYHPEQQSHFTYPPDPPANYHLQNRPPANLSHDFNKKLHNFTPPLEPLSELLLKLLNCNIITKAQPNNITGPPPKVIINLHCAFQMDMKEHDTTSS